MSTRPVVMVTFLIHSDSRCSVAACRERLGECRQGRAPLVGEPLGTGSRGVSAKGTGELCLHPSIRWPTSTRRPRGLAILALTA